LRRLPPMNCPWNFRKFEYHIGRFIFRSEKVVHMMDFETLTFLRVWILRWNHHQWTALEIPKKLSTILIGLYSETKKLSICWTLARWRSYACEFWNATTINELSLKFPKIWVPYWSVYFQKWKSCPYNGLWHAHVLTRANFEMKSPPMNSTWNSEKFEYHILVGLFSEVKKLSV